MGIEKESLLEIHDLSISFQTYGHALKQRELQVLSNLCLTVFPGEIIAVAGASGSGKSLLAAAILGLLPPNTTVRGCLYYKGAELTPARLARLRGTEMVLIPQSVAFLDPLMKAGKQVDGHRKPYPTQRRKELFSRLSLPEEAEGLYPFQLSGGMARRVLVSTALITDAQLIIADEPTPGMSPEQALETIKLLRTLSSEGRAVLLITHDIELAVEFADRVAIFYAGTTVETALASDFHAGPDALRHPYSQALWRSLPQNGFQPIGGFQPYPGELPKGCLFSPRCPYAVEKCHTQIPPVRGVRGGEVRCFHGT